MHRAGNTHEEPTGTARAAGVNTAPADGSVFSPGRARTGMPETMDCLRIEAWDGVLHRADAPVPDVGPTDVLVEVEATGVGRTVDKYVNGGMGDDPADLPRIPGHEFVGTVAESGAAVAGLSPGDRVTAYFHIGCGHCRYCQAALDPLCENHGGHVGVEMDGGFAEYARLPADMAIPVPDGIGPVAATAIPDAIATPYHVASRRAEVGPGDRVAVLGAAGGVGIHMLQVARAFGAEVTAVDIDDGKLEACADLGAEHLVNVADGDPAAALAEPGIDYDAVVDFTGETALLEAAVDRLAPRGRLVCLASAAGVDVGVPTKALVRGEIDVMGSRYCSKAELREAADLVASGTVEPVVSEVVGFDGVADLLERIVDDEVVGRGATTPE